MKEHHIPRNQVIATIRKILPEEHAYNFFFNRQYLMAVALDQASENTINKLKAAFPDEALLNKMAETYATLCNIFAVFTERSGRNKTVTFERSLLGYLTDGESHLKVYPNVDFSAYYRDR